MTEAVARRHTVDTAQNPRARLRFCVRRDLHVAGDREVHQVNDDATCCHAGYRWVYLQPLDEPAGSLILPGLLRRVPKRAR